MAGAGNLAIQKKKCHCETREASRSNLAQADPEFIMRGAKGLRPSAEFMLSEAKCAGRNMSHALSDGMVLFRFRFSRRGC